MISDIHNHLLFGMDDGATDIEDSILLIREQVKLGVKRIIMTPHFDPRKDDLLEFLKKRNKNLSELRQEVEKQGIEIELKVGAEIYYSSELLDLNLRDLAFEGTDYILLEFSTKMVPSNIKHPISVIMNQGLIPIFAHVERYAFFRDLNEEMVELINYGVLMQVNAESFINNDHKNFIKKCVKHNLIHLIASDAHSLVKRPPNLPHAYNMIKITFGESLMNYLQDNSNKVVDNEDVEVFVPSSLKKIFGRYI